MKLSFHIGKAGGQRSQTHNNRENYPEHADKALQGENIVLMDENPREYLTGLLRASVDEFNAKNEKKHPDRVRSLTEVVEDALSKTREIILQVGDKDAQLSREDYKSLYIDLINDFQTHNPNLRVFGAYIHFDETTPHIHLDVVPVCESTRGMKVKVSLDGAMRAMGYKDTGKYDETAFKLWSKDTREHLEQFCIDRGVDLEHYTPHTRTDTVKHAEKWQQLSREWEEYAQEWKEYAQEIYGDLEAIQDAFRENYERVRAVLDNPYADRAEILRELEPLSEVFKGGYEQIEQTMQTYAKPNHKSRAAQNGRADL